MKAPPTIKIGDRYFRRVEDGLGASTYEGLPAGAELEPWLKDGYCSSCDSELPDGPSRISTEWYTLIWACPLCEAVEGCPDCGDTGCGRDDGKWEACLACELPQPEPR